jgi:hypothetical protein
MLPVALPVMLPKLYNGYYLNTIGIPNEISVLLKPRDKLLRGALPWHRPHTPRSSAGQVADVPTRSPVPIDGMFNTVYCKKQTENSPYGKIPSKGPIFL